MTKTRKLYYCFTTSLGLCVVVTKVRGVGVLRSYGEHHQTPLDDLLRDAGFETTHPDEYLVVTNKLTSVYDRTVFTNEADSLKALEIVNKFYNCSERVKLSVDDFFKLLGF